MSKHFFARAVIVGLLGLVGMSLGCDKSPAGPPPPTAPSSLNSSTPTTPSPVTVSPQPSPTSQPDITTTSITLETRQWNGHVPANTADAVSTYFSLPLGVPGYAPTPKTLTISDNVSNQITFGGTCGTPICGPTGIGYHHHFAFNAPLSGLLAIRIGADFGGGGTLLIDGNLVEFRSNDMWADGSYSDPTQYLKGTVSITAGPHVIDSYGFEDCCDGAQQTQYSYLGSAYRTFQGIP